MWAIILYSGILILLYQANTASSELNEFQSGVWLSHLVMGGSSCPCSEISGGQKKFPTCPSKWTSRLWLLSGRLRGIIPLLICPHSLAVDLQEFSWSSTWQKSIFALKVNLRWHLLSMYIDWFQLSLIYILHYWGLERFLNLQVVQNFG